jgi:DNA-binding ferritin-like protein (Dps family)
MKEKAMSIVLTRIAGDKKEWRAMEARAKGLPRDYRVVYDATKSYLWKFTSGDGKDVVIVLKDVLAIFESSAADGRNVRDVTGGDVAAFCDGRLRQTPSYQGTWRTSLNREVADKLAR